MELWSYANAAIPLAEPELIIVAGAILGNVVVCSSLRSSKRT